MKTVRTAAGINASLGWRHITLSLLLILALSAVSADAQEFTLRTVIDECLKNSPEIKASEAKAEASRFRVPQAESLPDPMVMVGYQNEGLRKYTFGKSEDAQWMFGASQMFPFFGKRGLKGEMASRESESLQSGRDATRLRTVARVKELYYDLFTAHKTLDLLNERTALFDRVEEAALARYSTGKGAQQEVLMAQTEKYMLLERKEMLRQKIQALDAMLNAAVGGPAERQLGRPAEPAPPVLPYTLEDLIRIAQAKSPEIQAREKMTAAAEAKVSMAKREYFPDFTVAGTYFARGRQFEDMWSLTTTFNVPIFYNSKQRQAVFEADASLAEAKSESTATRLMIASAVRDNYAMVKAADRLTDIYKGGLIPKSYQDYELALSGYSTGTVDALTVVTRLKSVIDYEIAYWGQFAERGKAVARIEAIAALQDIGVNKNAGQ